jgi:hypothetical protein
MAMAAASAQGPTPAPAPIVVIAKPSPAQLVRAAFNENRITIKTNLKQRPI